jgi:SseB protein N-terminal domain
VAGRSILDLGYSDAFADDTGAADPALEAALAASSRDGAAAVSAALLGARLLVPIVASSALGEAPGGPAPRKASGESAGRHAADLAVVTVIGRDGRHALPAFTGIDALARWRADARPVPVRAGQAARAAFDEGAAALVLDIAGPIPHTVSGSRLVALAEGRAWRPAHTDGQVVAAVRAHLRVIAGTSVTAYLRPSDDADAVVLLVPSPDVDPALIETITRSLAARLATDAQLRARLDSGLDLAIATSSQQPVKGGVDQGG